VHEGKNNSHFFGTAAPAIGFAAGLEQELVFKKTSFIL
jgi:hypothetical protein